MNLTDKDLETLYRSYSDVVQMGCESARFRDMLVAAAAFSAINAKREQQRKHEARTQELREMRERYMREVVAPWSRELKADADRALLNSVLGARDQCEECGAHEGERHSLTCSVPTRPDVGYRCECGQTMTLQTWDRYGCGRCGRKPPVQRDMFAVPRDDMGTEVPTLEQWQRGDVTAAWTAESELTPAERTWRAHKGFTR